MGMNNFIRADGSPNSHVYHVLGAGLNIVLMLYLLLYLGWNVRGSLGYHYCSMCIGHLGGDVFQAVKVVNLNWRT